MVRQWYTNVLMFHQGSALPTMYTIDGKEYVIIPAFEKNGDQMLAFSIE